ncbi:MAG: glutamine amidotransferase-related protein [Elainellaceae cyanobacterium]
MPNKILMIVHQETSNPGLVGDVLSEMGYQLDVRCPAIEMPLPQTMSHHDAVVVFGGPMSANDSETLPFIRAELDWISMALASKKPFLGICLGAQLLARSLGARVIPHPDDTVEIGYFPLRSTYSGHSLFADLSQVYHWHSEGFELPSDAVLLATGDAFPHQAFRYGASAFGLQFHPEITSELVDRWTTQGHEQLVRPGAQPRDRQFQYHAHNSATVERWLRRFLNQWLDSSICLASSGSY